MYLFSLLSFSLIEYKLHQDDFFLFIYLISVFPTPRTFLSFGRWSISACGLTVECIKWKGRGAVQCVHVTYISNREDKGRGDCLTGEWDVDFRDCGRKPGVDRS